MRNFVLGVVSTLVLAVSAGAGYLVSTGLSTRDGPGGIETRVARAARHLAIPRSIRGQANAITPGPDAVAVGLKIFAGSCASCHANDGSGQIALGQAMFPRPPDMRLPATQEMTDGDLFYIIEYGVRFTGMPGWSNGTPEGEVMAWNLVHFIRHLPRLTPNEIADMEALNPQRP